MPTSLTVLMAQVSASVLFCGLSYEIEHVTTSYLELGKSRNEIVGEQEKNKVG